MIADRLVVIEQQLRSALDHARAAYRHAGLRGESLEVAVRAFLEQHLPSTVSVGTGETIDSAGNASRQTDIIISSRHHPIRYKTHEAGTYLVEGVEVAGEVKASLGLRELEDAILKGEQHKNLAPFKTVRSNHQALPSQPAPYFLVAFESKISPQRLIEKLFSSTSYDEYGYRSRAPLDAVFVLGQGACIDYGNGENPLQGAIAFGPLHSDLKVDLIDWCWHPSDYVLIWLLAWLHATIALSPKKPVPILTPYLFSSMTLTSGTIRMGHPRISDHLDPADPKRRPGYGWFSDD
ncbi:DUF6602 domain-containing protein [Nonomuraea bangladeshensis]|uniref:DUF6602 domain-containing protein n=1 Tax=Nonomuraea bangladeshensis TaxID=404385 RepID=UPI003C2E9413